MSIEFIAEPSASAWWFRGEVAYLPPELAQWFIDRGVAVPWRSGKKPAQRGEQEGNEDV